MIMGALIMGALSGRHFMCHFRFSSSLLLLLKFTPVTPTQLINDFMFSIHAPVCLFVRGAESYAALTACVNSGGQILQ